MRPQRVLALLAPVLLAATGCHDPVCQHLHDSKTKQAKACGASTPPATELAACDRGLAKCTNGDKTVLEDIADCYDLIPGCGAEDPDGGWISPQASCGVKAIAVSSTCLSSVNAGIDAPDAGPPSPFAGYFSGDLSVDLSCTNGHRDSHTSLSTFYFTVEGATLSYDRASDCQGVQASISGDTATINEHHCMVHDSNGDEQDWTVTGSFAAHDGVVDVDEHLNAYFPAYDGTCTMVRTGTVH